LKVLVFRCNKAAFLLCWDLTAQVREAISLTGQYAAVDDILTGRENMHMIGKLRHLDDVTGKTNELLLRFNLTEAADRRVATYSGGMRRRLDLAMSLLGAPSLVCMFQN
jgi:ABC-2 type transport system ATP-binding protein